MARVIPDDTSAFAAADAGGGGAAAAAGAGGVAAAIHTKYVARRENKEEKVMRGFPTSRLVMGAGRVAPHPALCAAICEAPGPVLLIALLRLLVLLLTLVMVVVLLLLVLLWSLPVLFWF